MVEESVPHYYVNKNAQTNGDHEVHESGCRQGAAQSNQLSLGYHASCHGAVAQAKQTYPTANGCAYVLP